MAATQKDQGEIDKAKQLKNVPWCEQYERMISGMMYDSFVPELNAGRFRARKWCHEYNNWFPTDDPDANFETLLKKREEMLKEILGSCGEGTTIEPPFIVS